MGLIMLGEFMKKQDRTRTEQHEKQDRLSRILGFTRTKQEYKQQKDK